MTTLRPGRDPHRRRRRRPGRAAGRPLPLRVAAPLAVAAGLALLLAFPPYGLWPLAPVGVALLAAAAHRRRLRGRRRRWAS